MGNVNNGAFAWDVTPPSGRTASSFNTPQRGLLVIHAPEGGEERINLPKSVTRILLSKKKSGEITPSSRAELLYMVKELTRVCARARIERLINKREYSTSELKKKLGMDGYPQSVIDECLQYATQIGLVSDAHYADSFIRSKVNVGWGIGRIERELKLRGIEANEVRGWPYDYLDPEEEVERAVMLAKGRSIPQTKPYERLVRFLCTKGYSTGVAVRAAKRVIQEHNDDFLVDF